MTLLQIKKQLINHIVLLDKWHLMNNTSPMNSIYPNKITHELQPIPITSNYPWQQPTKAFIKSLYIIIVRIYF